MKFAGTIDHLLNPVSKFWCVSFVTFDCISGRYCHCCQHIKFAIFISFLTLNHYTDTVFVMEHQNSPETPSSLSNPPPPFIRHLLYLLLYLYFVFCQDCASCPWSTVSDTYSMQTSSCVTRMVSPRSWSLPWKDPIFCVM